MSRVKNLCGEYGGKYISAGESGDAGKVYHYGIVLLDATFSVLTRPAYDDNSSPGAIAAALAVVYPAQSVVYGQITAATLTSGLVQLVEWDTLGIM